MITSLRACSVALALSCLLLACGPDGETPSDNPSEHNAGGATNNNGTGGKKSGGGTTSTNTGGTTSTSTGGTSARGGSAGVGGKPGSNTGGSGSSGGTVSTGGSSTTGGRGGAAGENAQGGAAGSTNQGPNLPAKILAGYYPNWTEAPVRIRDINPNYNVIYLFAAKPLGGAPGTTGAVVWQEPGDGRKARTNWNADIKHARTVQGRKVILSVGGAGGGMSFPTRKKSETFVASIVELYERFGGFDGLDWNTFEADQTPDTSEMIWISLEFKRRYPGFIISSPPAPWNKRDQTFCKAMVTAGAMDYAAPQYYDGPGLDLQSYIVKNAKEWVTLLGASHVVVGFGIWDQPDYMSVAEAIPTWNELENSYSDLRGAFNWQIHIDEQNKWEFADKLGPLVR